MKFGWKFIWPGSRMSYVIHWPQWVNSYKFIVMRKVNNITLTTYINQTPRKVYFEWMKFAENYCNSFTNCQVRKWGWQIVQVSKLHNNFSSGKGSHKIWDVITVLWVYLVFCWEKKITWKTRSIYDDSWWVCVCIRDILKKFPLSIWPGFSHNSNWYISSIKHCIPFLLLYL